MPRIGAAGAVGGSLAWPVSFSRHRHAEVVVRLTRPCHVADAKPAVSRDFSLLAAAGALMDKRRVCSIGQAQVGIGLLLMGVRIDRANGQDDKRADRSLARADMQDPLASLLSEARVGRLGVAVTVFVGDA